MRRPLPKGLTVQKVRGREHPFMQASYDALFGYFGGRGEMETLDVIHSRFDWSPADVIDGFAYLYEMVAFTDPDGAVAAVRDHSVILDVEAIRAGAMPVVVHLSHILVAPEHSGRALVPRLHDYPIDAAREALERAGLPPSTPIVLAAEVEPYLPGDRERTNRLKLFKRAGYRPADFELIPYVQPDFRHPDVIDGSGGPEPLSLVLMLWRVDKEHEEEVACGEIQHVVRCLYQMYGRGMRRSHMDCVYEALANYPPAGAAIPLVWGRSTGI